MCKRAFLVALSLILLCGAVFEPLSLFPTALSEEMAAVEEDASPDSYMEEATPEPTEEPTVEPTEEPAIEPTEEPSEGNPSPDAESTLAPTTQATDVPPAASTQAPTTVPPMVSVEIPTLAPSDNPKPAVTAAPLPAERMAAELGMTLQELADALNVTVEQLFLMSEEALAELYAALYAVEPIALEHPDFEVQDGVLMRYTGEDANVEIPGDLGITAIGTGAFQDNANLRSVVIPYGVVEIGRSAFQNCALLDSVDLPETLASIGETAFDGCVSLMELTLPASIESMGERGFANCENLTLFVREGSAAHALCAAAGYRYAIVGWPTSLQIAPTQLTLGVGETVENALKTSLSPEEAERYALQYEVSNSNISYDASTGTLKGKKVGSATVTAFIANGSLNISASCKVTVKAAPTAAIASPSKVTLGIDDSCQLTVKPSSSGAASYQFTYSSDNPDIADVTSEGLIIAKDIGTATITAKTFNKQKAVCSVTVRDRPSDIFLSASSITLALGQTTTLSVTLPAKTATTCTFTSENGCVTVNAKGLVETLKPGEDTIIVKTHNNIIKTCAVTVLPMPSSIELNQTKATLGQGETFKLVPSVNKESQSNYTFKSNNTAVATVSSAGKISAKKVGSATITVKTHNGLSATCAVTVKAAPTAISLTPKKLTIGAKDSKQLTAKLTPSSAKSLLTYSSNKPEIADVTSEGLIIAKGIGTATITVETFNKKRDFCTVYVKRDPDSVEFTNIPTALGAGECFPLAAEVNPGTVGSITYSITEGQELASISGVTLYAAAPGTIKVCAKAHNGVSTDAAVEIKAAPTSIKLEETLIYLGVGESLSDALHASVNEGSAGSFTFKSTNTSIVKVNASSGKLSAKKAGTAYVYATAYNGVASERCKIVVRAAPKKITLSVPTKKISVGQVLTPEIKLSGSTSGHCTLKSYNTAAVIVNDDMTLCAVGVGDAKITATCFNTVSSSITLKVVDPPTSVVAEQEMYTVAEGLQTKVAFLTPGSYADYTYTSDNPEIAFIEEHGDGTITGIAAGTTTITATTHNGLPASTTVEVLPAPQRLIPEVSELTLGVGEKHTFTFSPLPENALASYTYRSSNTAVATINAQGTISALAEGRTVITVTSHTGVSTQMQLVVVSYSSLHPTYAVAHRGASGYRKGNTLDAFRYAVELGAEWIELDVRKSSDGKIVVVHDAAIKNSSGSKKNISALTLSQIQKIDPSIPTFESVLAYIAKTDVQIMIELKVSGIEKNVIDLVAKYNMQDRVAYGSFLKGANNSIRSIDPSAKLIYLLKTKADINAIIKNPSKYNYPILSINYALLNASTVRTLHLLGYKIFVWTVNSPTDIKKMMNMGVDAITTDYPDRL